MLTFNKIAFLTSVTSIKALFLLFFKIEFSKDISLQLKNIKYIFNGFNILCVLCTIYILFNFIYLLFEILKI